MWWPNHVEYRNVNFGPTKPRLCELVDILTAYNHHLVSGSGEVNRVNGDEGTDNYNNGDVGNTVMDCNNDSDGDCNDSDGDHSDGDHNNEYAEFLEECI